MSGLMKALTNDAVGSFLYKKAQDLSALVCSVPGLYSNYNAITFQIEYRKCTFLLYLFTGVTILSICIKTALQAEILNAMKLVSKKSIVGLVINSFLCLFFKIWTKELIYILFGFWNKLWNVSDCVILVLSEVRMSSNQKLLQFEKNNQFTT